MMKNWKSLYFHKPFRDKSTFNYWRLEVKLSVKSKIYIALESFVLLFTNSNKYTFTYLGTMCGVSLGDHSKSTLKLFDPLTLFT